MTVAHAPGNAPRPPVSDADLLAACRIAGNPGTESHTLASRTYRRSVLQWRAADARWRRERARREVADAVADVASVVVPALMLRHRAGR